MSTPSRPDFIRNLDEFTPEPGTYPGDDEPMSAGIPIGHRVGLKRIGVHIETLLPGQRTSWPHAEELEEEFVLVLEGAPHAWIDGHLYPLRAGDAVGFPSGTGIMHTFINNSDAPARLVVLGEHHLPGNRIRYAFHPTGWEGMKPERVWTDAPVHPQGEHDGLPDQVRARKG